MTQFPFAAADALPHRLTDPTIRQIAGAPARAGSFRHARQKEKYHFSDEGISVH